MGFNKRNQFPHRSKTVVSYPGPGKGWVSEELYYLKSFKKYPVI